MDARGATSLRGLNQLQEKKLNMPVIKENYNEEENLSTNIDEVYKNTHYRNCQEGSESVKTIAKREQSNKAGFSQAFGCLSTLSSIQKSFITNPNSSSYHMELDDQLKKNKQKDQNADEKNPLESISKQEDLDESLEQQDPEVKIDDSMESIESIIDFNDNFIMIQSVQFLSLMMIFLLIGLELVYI